MNENQQAAFLQSQTACALIECAAMQAENQIRAVRGESPAWDEAAFLSLMDKYGITHNRAIEMLR